MSGNVQSILRGETDNDQAFEGSKMKKRRAQAGAAGEFNANHQNNPAPICLNSSFTQATNQTAFLLGRFQPLLGREPASVP